VGCGIPKSAWYLISDIQYSVSSRNKPNKGGAGKKNKKRAPMRSARPKPEILATAGANQQNLAQFFSVLLA
jgi:hypothetical protein